MLQCKREARRITSFSDQGNQHAARHEIADLYGLSLKPPAPAILW